MPHNKLHLAELKGFSLMRKSSEKKKKNERMKDCKKLFKTLTSMRTFHAKQPLSMLFEM